MRSWVFITAVGIIAAMIGVLATVAVFAAVVLLREPAAAPPVATTVPPSTAPPAPTATPPTRTPTPLPQPTAPPAPTPPPIARCLTADQRSLDLERIIHADLMELVVSIYSEPRYRGVSPPSISITGVTAINVRHLGGGLYQHSASYEITRVYPGERPQLDYVVVSGTIRAQDCVARVR